VKAAPRSWIRFEAPWVVGNEAPLAPPGGNLEARLVARPPWTRVLGGRKMDSLLPGTNYGPQLELFLERRWRTVNEEEELLLRASARRYALALLELLNVPPAAELVHALVQRVVLYGPKMPELVEATARYLGLGCESFPLATVLTVAVTPAGDQEGNLSTVPGDQVPPPAGDAGDQVPGDQVPGDDVPPAGDQVPAND